MTISPRLVPFVATATLLFTGFLSACGSGGNARFSGEVGTYDPDAGLSLNGGDASGAAALDAYIEQGSVKVTLITLSCSGDCATVEAVGTGGYPPYTFAWQDGLTSATRQVCPTSTASYLVRVTDTGTSGEFARAPESAQASVTAKVLACPDGGESDSGASGDACTGELMNLSIEGTPGSGTPFTPWDAPSWVNCGLPYGAPSQVVNASTTGWSSNGNDLPAPTDGQTYAAIQITPQPALPGGIGQQLCSPLGGGASRSFELDAMGWFDVPDGGSSPGQVTLQIFGGDSACCGDTACAANPLLWTSPPLTNSWATYCATLDPVAVTPSLTFFGATDSVTGEALILLDDIRPVAACP